MFFTDTTTLKEPALVPDLEHNHYSYLNNLLSSTSYLARDFVFLYLLSYGNLSLASVVILRKALHNLVSEDVLPLVDFSMTYINTKDPIFSLEFATKMTVEQVVKTETSFYTMHLTRAAYLLYSIAISLYSGGAIGMGERALSNTINHIIELEHIEDILSGKLGQELDENLHDEFNYVLKALTKHKDIFCAELHKDPYYDSHIKSLMSNAAINEGLFWAGFAFESIMHPDKFLEVSEKITNAPINACKYAIWPMQQIYNFFLAGDQLLLAEVDNPA